MKSILVRVGIDHSYGKWNAPADPDTQQFVYVAIPEYQGVSLITNHLRLYDEVVPHIQAIANRHNLDASHDLRFPAELLGRPMHLDPDFDYLTYGDIGDRRGSEIRQLNEDDLLVFYAGLRPLSPCQHKLIYAIIGLYVIDEIVNAVDVPQSRRNENAHTRRQNPGPSEIVVRAKPNLSGRLERYIPIGEYRNRAYRVRQDILDAWGGLSVNDGYIQRSARPPKFQKPEQFYEWFKAQNVHLIDQNNPAATGSKVVIAHLRQPRINDPTEMRSDPFWEFGSFGCTGCHSKNLMNPKRIQELSGVRLAFAQGGPDGFKLVMLTPPVKVVRHQNRCEVKWDPADQPFRYSAAPTLIGPDGYSDFKDLKNLLQSANRSTWLGQFSSMFRSRRTPLPTRISEQICQVYDQFRRQAVLGDYADQYEDALPYPPNKIDRSRLKTYQRTIKMANGNNKGRCC